MRNGTPTSSCCSTFSNTGAALGKSTYRYAAASLANAYIERKDRVGFLEFGGHLRWIQPATGRRHSEVLAEGMLPSASHFSYVVPRLDRLPKRVLPPQALVLAVTPLLDDRIVGALVDLAARGYELVVIAVSPIEPTRVVLQPSLLNNIACRLWAMEWQARIAEQRQRGLAIVEWHPDMPLEAALASDPAGDGRGDDDPLLADGADPSHGDGPRLDCCDSPGADDRGGWLPPLRQV
jgi:hypothetical protein